MAGLNQMFSLADDVARYLRACGKSSILQTKPVNPSQIKSLHFAPKVIGDTVNISKTSLLHRVLGGQVPEKEIYDVTKWQKEFFAKTYDKLKTPEEKAVYIEKLRQIINDIKHDKFDEFHLFIKNDIERINYIQENFPYFHHTTQEKIVSLLRKNEIPDFYFEFDNNKMFELILKDKKYNLDYVKECMSQSYYSIADKKVFDFSKKIDENIARLGIKLPQQNAYEIPQQLKASELDASLYHEIPLYHGVRGGDEVYKMALFKKHGSSRFGPINSTGTNVLFTTGGVEYAEWYGGPNVLKMYCRKDFPILNDVDVTLGLRPDGWSDERLIYDLLYEKGIKFLKNGRETLIIDPKAVTYVSDFKNNYKP